jgi:ArsR family transcriptional regulator
MNQALREEIAQLHAELCSALADPNRILLLYVLADRAHHVNELAISLGLPQPTISRHLKVLRERGLVSAERDGQSVYYMLADQRVLEALDLLRVVLADQLKTHGELAHTARLSLKEEF